MGCHFLLQGIFPDSGIQLMSLMSPAVRRWRLHVQVLSCPVVSNSLQSHGLFAIPWTLAHQGPPFVEFSVGEYWSELPCLPPGVSSTQASNPSLPLCRWILYCLSHQGSPRILERVACPFCRGTSRPRS